jgi:DNA-binding LytR/AlgR family response regulator
MPSALIADDEPHLAQYLRDMLASLWPELEVVAVVHDGPAAAAAIARERPDIAFLDIRMPGATGLEVAEGVLANPASATRVVFVTAFDQYAVDAFERDAVDYLLKPVTSERLARTIEKLRRSARTPGVDLSALLAEITRRLPEAAPSHLRWIRASKRSSDGEITHQIPVDEVVYIQADDKYTCVYSSDGKELAEWLIRIPLSELAAQLDPSDFAQIHRSVIVNLHAVTGTRRDLAGKLYVRLRDHARELPVSRQYLHLFQKM